MMLVLLCRSILTSVGPATGHVTKGNTACANGDNADDCSALVALWAATDKVLPWADGSSLCTWMSMEPSSPAISCDKHTKRVTEVYLSDNGLTGSIPPELGKLSSLQTLHLEDNGLTGSIPPELGNLSSLWGLYFNANGLTGLVPTQLCPLINGSKTLEYCYLEDNSFQCPLPGCVKGASGHGGCGATCN